MMKEKLPKPFEQAIIYEDTKLYVCLANYPIAKGHTVIIWKKSVQDLHLLQKKDYEYLMDKVDEIRNALIKTLKVKKVYLIYMDEDEQIRGSASSISSFDIVWALDQVRDLIVEYSLATITYPHPLFSRNRMTR